MTIRRQGQGRGRRAYNISPGECTVDGVCKFGRLAVGPIPCLRSKALISLGKCLGREGKSYRELGHAFPDIFDIFYVICFVENTWLADEQPVLEK